MEYIHEGIKYVRVPYEKVGAGCDECCFNRENGLGAYCKRPAGWSCVNLEPFKDLYVFKRFVPKRIQRKRSKGWRMPENTQYVGRGTKWGNPLKVVRDHPKDPFGMIVVLAFEDETRWINTGFYGDEKDVVLHYSNMIQGKQFKESYLQVWSDYLSKLDFSELKGKDLACWCPLDKPCHADVLIEFINTQVK